MSIQYDSNGLPVFVPDEPAAVSAKTEAPGLWTKYAKPTIEAIGGIASTPYRGAGMLAGLAQEGLGGAPRVKLTGPSTGLWDDITGRSVQAPSLGSLAVEGAKLGTLALAPEASDLIGERIDARNASGLAEQTPEEIRAWQNSHPIAAYTKAIAEPIAELGVGMALDPTLGAMRLLSAAPKAAALLKAAESASLAGRTVEAAETAARAAETLRSSKILQTIASGTSEVGAFLASHPGLSNTAERAIGAAYVPGMAQGFVDEAVQAAKDYREQGMSPDTVKAGLGAASQAIFAGMGLKHAVMPEPVGAPARSLSPERLSSALQGADLAGEIAQAREAAPVAPTAQEAPPVAAVPEAPAAVAGAVPAEISSGGPTGTVVQAGPDISARPLDLEALRSDIGRYGREVVSPAIREKFLNGETDFTTQDASALAPPGATPEDVEAIRQHGIDRLSGSMGSRKWISELNAKYGGEGPEIQVLPVGSPEENGSLVLQRAEGKIVGAGQGKNGFREMVAGGRDQGSPVSISPVYAALDRLGYLPSEELSPQGREAQENHARKLSRLAQESPAVGRDLGLAPDVARSEPIPGSPVGGGEVRPVSPVSPEDTSGISGPSPSRSEPIIAANRREAYQALRERYPDQPPDVKTMVDVHGVKPEWALDIAKRWGNPAWETKTAYSVPELTPAQKSEEILSGLKPAEGETPEAYLSRLKAARVEISRLRRGASAEDAHAIGLIDSEIISDEYRVKKNKSPQVSPANIQYANQIIDQQLSGRGFGNRPASEFRDYLEMRIDSHEFPSIPKWAWKDILDERFPETKAESAPVEAPPIASQRDAAWAEVRRIATELQKGETPELRKAFNDARERATEISLREEAENPEAVKGGLPVYRAETSVDRPAFTSIQGDLPRVQAALGSGWSVGTIGQGDAARWLVRPESASGIAFELGLDNHIRVSPEEYQRAYGKPLSDAQAKAGALGRTVIQNGIPWQATIALAKGRAGEATLNHEMFHAATFLALGPDGVKQMQAKYGQNGWQERAADAYAKWSPEHPNTLFTPIYDFFRNIWQAITGQQDRTEQIFRLVQTGKIFNRMGGLAFSDPTARQTLSAELESKPPATKKQVAMALANDLGISDIIRHEEGDSFLFDASSLLRGAVTPVERTSPFGVAFLRDVVDQKTNYGNYQVSLAKARGFFGDDLQQKYQQWLNTRKLPSVGTAFERMRGGVEVGVKATSGSAERALLNDMDSIMPDIKQSLGVQGIGKKLGAGSFANVYDLGEGADGARVVARVSSLPGNNARPRMESEFIVPETGRYFTADGREVVIQPYTYSHEEVGNDAKRAQEVSADLTKKLEAEGFKNIDVSTPNVRYLDKEGKRPVVVDLGAVKPFDSDVPSSEWIANKIPEMPGNRATQDAMVGEQRRSELPLIAMTNGFFGDYMGRLRYLFVNKFHYLERAERGVSVYQGKGEIVPKEQSGASALELVPSKAQKMIEDVVDVAKDDIDRLGARDGTTMDELRERLNVEHAPVRNRWGRQRKDTDGGPIVDASGISDAEASDRKAKLVESGAWQRTQAVADRVHALMWQQLDIAEKYGTIPPEQIAALRADPEWVETYVPQKHDDPLRPWRPSSGAGGVHAQLKHFTGRAAEAENPIGYALAQVAQTIAQGEKTLALRTMSRFIKDNPDPGWQVLDTPPMRRSLNDIEIQDAAGSHTEQHVVEHPDTSGLIAYFEPGGVEKYIKIEDPRVMQSLQNAGPDTTSQVLKYISKGVKLYSGLLTRWNPEFILPNFQRDLQMALASIGIEHKVGAVKDVFKGVGPGIKAAWRVLRDPNATGEWEDAYKEYSRNGGPMRVLELKSGPQYLDEVSKGLNDLVHPNQFKRVFFGAMKALDNANGAVETGVRLSYYKMLRKAGASEVAATHASKNLTVNFDRRGALSPQLNSLYLFFNASMQGGVRVAKVLNSPRGRIAGMAMMAAGVAMDQMNAATTEDTNGDGISDWDSVPEYVKERNILIGKATIPMPYGFNVLLNTGRLMSAWSRGAMSAGQAASNGALSAFSTFNPFGGASDFTQMVTPSFLEPFVQLSMNKNFAGNAIVPEQPKWGPKKPDSERYWRTTSPVAQWLAQTGNKLTGGDKLTSGVVDISPNTIEYWSNFALGGWSRILTGGEAVAEGIAKGEAVPLSKIPIVRRQVYEEHPADVGRMWRATQEEMDQLKARAEMYAKDRQYDRLRTLPRPLLGMSDYMAEVQRATQEIQKAQRAGQLSDEEAQARVRQMQIKSLFNITKARERAKDMGFNPGYAAAPESGV